jgi:predicted TIM-barrel fold metal-dependent hydrolase
MSFTLSGGAVDAWINPNFPVAADNPLDVSYLFPGLKERLERGTTLDELVEQLDAAGVAKGLLCSGYSGPGDEEWVKKAIATYPDRFAGSHVIDPRQGMAAVRKVEQLVNDDGYRLIRMLGLQTLLPYDNAVYYPIYAKCIELGVPVGLNVGFPGPLVPSKHQDPLPIDDVCSHFPELVVVLQHGGEPWVDTCVKLMIKWRNIHYMTSAFAPKHIPKQVIDYVNSRGADRVMWASDFPLLTHERCLREAAELPFKDQDRFDRFMTGNAEALFFS